MDVFKLYAEGQELSLRNELVKAIAYYNQIIALAPNWFVPYFDKGECLRHLYRREEAIESYQKCILLAPKWYKPYTGMGECFKISQNWDLAIDYYNKALKRHLEDYRAYWGLGDCYRMKEQVYQAIPMYEIAISLAPEWDQPYVGLGECFKKLRKYDEAINLYKHSYSINPNSEIPFAAIGECLKYQYSCDEAIEFFKKALTINPNSAISYYEIGNCLRMQLHFHTAIEWYQKSIEKEASFYRPYFGIGECLRNIGDYLGAKKYFYKAINGENNFSDAYWGLSQLPITAFQNEEVSGIPNFNKAIILNRVTDLGIEFPFYLKYCLNLDSFSILFDIIDKLINENLLFLINVPQLSELVTLSTPFQKQFEIWKYNPERSQHSLSLEAIMRFHLGSAISSYEIFNNEMEDTDEHPLSIIDQYYFALAAYNIIEPHQGCIDGISLPIAKRIIAATSVHNEEEWNDRYYAALVMDLANETQSALSVLHELKEVGFIPAYLKWAELKRKNFPDDESYQQDIIGGMASDYQLLGSPYLYPEMVLLSGTEEEMFRDLLPLIQTMENRAVIELIHAWKAKNGIATKDSVFEQRYLFARKIIFPDLQEDKLYQYIYEYYPRVHEKVFQAGTNLDLLETDIQHYHNIKAKGKDCLAILSDIIHQDFYTAYNYEKQNLACPSGKGDYWYYLVLVTHLQKEDIITRDEASLLHEYIKYGMNVVQNVSENEALEFLIGKAKDYIPTAALCGVGYSDIEKAVNYTFHKVKGKQSDLISFPAYRALVEKRNAEN